MQITTAADVLCVAKIYSNLHNPSFDFLCLDHGNFENNLEIGRF